MKRLESHLLLNVVGYGDPDDTDFPGELQISNDDECIWYVPKAALVALEAKLKTMTEHRNELMSIGQDLESDLATAREKAFAEAAQIALRHTEAFPARRIADAIEARAAQPQPAPEAEPGDTNPVDLTARVDRTFED